MRWQLCVCGVALCLGIVSETRSDEAVRSIADKAIKAMGGEKLSEAHAASWKAKGSANVNGEEVTFKADWTIQGDSKTHINAQAEANGSTINVYLILNGNKGWASLAGIREDMDEERIAEEKERAYVEWLTTFIPLHDSRLHLTALGDSKVGDRDAVGLKVGRKGRRDVFLYFDRDAGRLLKAHSRIKDLLTGSEAEQDIFFEKYTTEGGVPHASKVVYKRDKNPYLDMSIRDFHLEKQAPAKLFQKP